MKDLQILQKKTMTIQPCLLDKIYDKNFLLYQKILILLLSNVDSLYRNDGCNLVQIMQGSNVPDPKFLQTLATSCCDQVITTLDAEDRALLQRIWMSVDNGQLNIHVKMKNAQLFEGILA